MHRFGLRRVRSFGPLVSIALTLSVGLPLRAGDVIASVTNMCTLGSTVVGPASTDCSITLDTPAGNTTMSGDGSGGISGFGTPTLTGGAFTDDNFQYITIGIPTYLSEPFIVTTTVSLTVMVYANGVGPGFLSSSGNAGTGDGGTFDGVGWSAFPTGADVSGVGGCGAPLDCQWNSGLVPVTLGTPFEVSIYLNALVGSAGGSNGGNFGAAGRVSFNVQAFDANDNPIDINAVPEPSTFGVVVLAIGLYGFVRGTKSFRNERAASQSVGII